MTSDILKKRANRSGASRIEGTNHLRDAHIKNTLFQLDAFWIFQDCAIFNNSIKYNSIVLPSEIFREICNIWGFRLFIIYWKWHNPQEIHKASTEMRILYLGTSGMVGGSTHSEKRTTNYRVLGKKKQ